MRVKCLLDDTNIALQHIKTGYSSLIKEIEEINTMEESYRKNVSDKLQSFIDSLYGVCKSELTGWDICPDVYTPIEKAITFVPAEVTESDTDVIKKIDIVSLANSLIESIKRGAICIEPKKNPFGSKAPVYTMSLTFKTEELGEFRNLSTKVAETKNYDPTEEELSKFGSIWIKLKSEVEDIKKVYEEHEKIMKKYEDLREKLTRDILNTYSAGIRMNGECEVCKLTRNASEDKIRPYFRCSENQRLI